MVTTTGRGEEGGERRRNAPHAGQRKYCFKADTGALRGTTLEIVLSRLRKKVKHRSGDRERGGRKEYDGRTAIIHSGVDRKREAVSLLLLLLLLPLSLFPALFVITRFLDEFRASSFSNCDYASPA